MSQKFLYWLAVEENKPVRFSNLAHMVAKAMHPTDDWGYAGARVNLDSELPKAVQNGQLVVRNPLDLGPHTFPYGDALKRSVLLPNDLRPFLETRSIELRLIPHGSGPRYWTLENAAIAIAEQENWHDGARGTLLDQLIEAANARELVVRDPHTGLRKGTGDIRQFYELVSPADVNAWLEAQGAKYRWNPPPPPEGDNADENQPAAYVPPSTLTIAARGGETEVRPTLTVLKHKVRSRSDPLAAVIEAAKEAAVNGEDYQSVWAALVKMAEAAPPAPVVGYVPREGVQYRVDDDGEELRYFTKDALRKRMNPTARGG